MHINRDKTNCCGCSACYSICPTKAISMQPDALGFKYPMIDVDKCIDCGLCKKVCQFKSDYDRYEVSDSVVYALRNVDESELLKSQSGAAFWSIAKVFIQDGGIVYGVGYGDNYKIIHKRVKALTELEELRGSKYVQSDVGETFREVVKDLDSGFKVLYSGTSCQIANLKAYVGAIRRNNLYTIDIVCHGVPSPFVWKDFLSYIETKSKKKISSVNFRDKSKGWKNCVSSFVFSDKSVLYTKDYSKLFYSNLALRECCYVCPFTNFRRVSDITIGDFWGWGKSSNLYNDDKGVSLILVCSNKGVTLLDSVKSEVYLKKMTKQSCLQKNLQEPTKCNSLRKKFEYEYQKRGFVFVYKKYIKLNIIEKIIRKIKLLLKVK